MKNINVHITKLLAVTLLLLAGIWFSVCLPDPLFRDPYCLAVADRDGSLLCAQIAEDHQWRFPENDSIPQVWKNAILCFEDRRFYRHFGVDPVAIARAVKENMTAGKIVSGASTLSMQVIRLSRKNKPRTLFQKIVETILALRLEMKFSKDEILKLYASHAPFGGNVIGLEAASWRYYHKPPSNLSLSEAATLAVLPNAPSLIHPGKNRELLRHKRDALLKTMVSLNYIDSTQYELAVLENLPGAPIALPQLAPHLLQHIKQFNTPNRKFKSSIHNNIQRKLIAISDIHHEINKMSDINNLAVIVVNTRTGKILGYVGNAHKTSHEANVDAIQANRSSGSILKPFLYAHMLDEAYILPRTLVADIPTQIQGFKPKNYDKNYAGAIPADEALSKSLNIPFVIMLRQYGVQKFLNKLKEHRFESINRGADDYGLSLILGGAEVNLFDLTRAYASLGASLIDYKENDRKFRNLKSYELNFTHENIPPELTSSEEQLSPGAIYLTFEALRNLSRPDLEGLWQQFSSARPIAWKTGTSYGHKDAWAVGVTPEYTIGVWVGNADGEGKNGLVGVERAAPLLFDVLNSLPPTSWFSAPLDDLYVAEICKLSGHIAGQYCDAVDSTYVLKKYQNTVQCPYHHPVFLDTSFFLAQSDCTPTYLMHQYNWFTLPPSQAYYYKRAHPEYKHLPEPNPECRKTASASHRHPLALIYPTESSKIYLPKGGDGLQQNAIFKAAHDYSKSVVHWHLDETYLGTTQEIHTMEVNASEGKHNILLIDQWGNETSQNFEIVQ